MQTAKSGWRRRRGWINLGLFGQAGLRDVFFTFHATVASGRRSLAAEIRRGENRLARVLLVEDDPDVRATMQYLLQMEEHRVVTVGSIATALSRLRAETFDLVVTDVALPDGSGLAVADSAKEMGIAALVVTGYARSLKDGAFDHYDCLFKPFRLAEFLKTIRSRLARAGGEVIAFPKN